MRIMEERAGTGRQAMPEPVTRPGAAESPTIPASGPDRRGGIPSSGNRSGPAPRWDSAGTTLTIPRGIRYSGRIGPCERLIVEGVVETELDGGRVLAVAGGGVFRGRADVETADISGTLEGQLRVRGTLTVRASARIVSESFSYGELEIERGGVVAGTARPADDYLQDRIEPVLPNTDLPDCRRTVADR